MPQFLFIVEVPPIPTNSHGLLESNDWSQFRCAADTKIKTAKSAVRLQPNAWLLPAEKTLPLLTELAALAKIMKPTRQEVLLSARV